MIFALLVDNDIVVTPSPRAIEQIETWTCGDFDFVTSEAIETLLHRFEIDVEYGLVFSSLGHCSAVGYMGAWEERVL